MLYVSGVGANQVTVMNIENITITEGYIAFDTWTYGETNIVNMWLDEI